MLYPISERAPPESLALYSDMTDSPFNRLRVRQLMKEQKVSQASVARLLNINQSAVSNILNGTRKVSVEEAHLIYDLLGINHAIMEEHNSTVRSIPIIGLAAAGKWREAIQMSLGDVFIANRSAGKNAFAVEVDGDSMDRLIQHGHYAIVDPDQLDLFDGKFYLVQNDAGETTIKQYRDNPARLEPMSNNPAHVAIPLGAGDCTVIGRVVGAQATY